VVDSGVALKTVFLEPASDRADELLALPASDPLSRLLVPDLFFVECANVLWKHVQRGTIPETKAHADMLHLGGLLLARTSTADLAVDALRIALDWSISAYDTCYVALSRREAVPLVTADEKLVRKIA
jgi:predicted nucleic acid-binding protein